VTQRQFEERFEGAGVDPGRREELQVTGPFRALRLGAEGPRPFPLIRPRRIVPLDAPLIIDRRLVVDETAEIEELLRRFNATPPARIRRNIDEIIPAISRLLCRVFSCEQETVSEVVADALNTNIAGAHAWMLSPYLDPLTIAKSGLVVPVASPISAVIGIGALWILQREMDLADDIGDLSTYDELLRFLPDVRLPRPGGSIPFGMGTILRDDAVRRRAKLEKKLGLAPTPEPIPTPAPVPGRQQ